MTQDGSSNIRSLAVGHGIAWTVAARWFDRLLGLVSMAILARILAPEDFGIVATAVLAFLLVDAILTFGFDWALVRHPGPTQSHYNTAFSLRVTTSLVAAALLAVAAPLIGGFFKEPRVTPIVWLLALNGVIWSFENPYLARLRREMNFRTEFFVRGVARFVGVVCACTIALSTGSYWALPLGTTAMRIVEVATSYWLCAGRPSWEFGARRDLMSFSVWMMVRSVLAFAQARLSNALVARQLGAAPLGMLVVSQEVTAVAFYDLAGPINRVLFTEQSRMSGDVHALRDVYLKGTGVVMLTGLPLAMGVMAIAPILVKVLFGAAWSGAVPVVEILALASAVTLFSANSSMLLLSRNDDLALTCIAAVVVGVQLLTMLILVPRMGLNGAAIGFLAGSVASVALTNQRCHQKFRVSHYRYARYIWRPLVSAALMLLAIRGFETSMLGAVPWKSDVLSLLFFIGIGAAIYTGAIAVLSLTDTKSDSPERLFVRYLKSACQKTGAARGP
jgi:O-antigen/teichoic acid export membrane protein